MSLPRYVITRFGSDDPRLIEVTSENPAMRRVHGRDVMRGGHTFVRTRDVIARHADRDQAMAAFRAVRAACPGLDAGIARARRAYDRAARERDAALAALARGEAPQPAAARP